MEGSGDHVTTWFLQSLVKVCYLWSLSSWLELNWFLPKIVIKVGVVWSVDMCGHAPLLPALTGWVASMIHS